MIPQVLVLVLEPRSCGLSGVLQRNASYQCKTARNRGNQALIDLSNALVTPLNPQNRILKKSVSEGSRAL